MYFTKRCWSVLHRRHMCMFREQCVVIYTGAVGKVALDNCLDIRTLGSLQPRDRYVGKC